MQYLVLEGNETLTSLSRLFGQSITSDILALNGISRTPNIAKEWEKQCQAILDSDMKEVSPERKMILLNTLTDTDDVFEKACLMDENEWKIFSVTQSFSDALRIPETTAVPYSSKVIGSVPTKAISTNPSTSFNTLIVTSTTSQKNKDSKITNLSSTAAASVSSNPVSSNTYRAVVNSLKATGSIDPGIFNGVNSAPASAASGIGLQATSSEWAYPLPWGKIQMYSTILGELIDFPVYPETVNTNRQASYASMPDIIYQYEPWITFENSGPREQSLSFHMHRDMWTGDHRDGQANKLIRFCEANTFADYNGSAVVTPIVRLYMDGTLFISGVIKNVDVEWSGPLGIDDNWYLEFTLSLAMQEVSESALNCKSFYTRALKEG